MSEKTKGLAVNVLLYAAAFAVGFVPFNTVDSLFLAEAAFTASATLFIYIVTCFVDEYKNKTSMLIPLPPKKDAE